MTVASFGEHDHQCALERFPDCDNDENDDGDGAMANSRFINPITFREPQMPFFFPSPAAQKSLKIPYFCLKEKPSTYADRIQHRV